MREPLACAYGKLDRFAARLVNALRLLRLRMMGASIGAGVRVYGRFTVRRRAR